MRYPVIQISGKPCPSDCTNPTHGVCDKRTGKCNCNDGFTGDTCTGTFLHKELSISQKL